MDQLDAFHYFLTNLFLHNLVLVAGAVLLGVVLGRLMFGTRKVMLDQLREALKEEENRSKGAERELAREQARHAKALEDIAAGGAVRTPAQDTELETLRSEKAELEGKMGGMAGTLEDLGSRMKKLEAQKEGLENELAELRESGVGEGAARAEVEKMLTTIQGLQQRVADAEIRVRKELEGELETLRGENKRLEVELAESQEAGTGENAELIKLAEENERLEKDLQGARKQVEELEESAKKARHAKSLPARRGSKADIGDLEKRLAEAIQEREQVEKASAVLRKEMRGLRNKVKAIEQQDSHESELELALKETEERLTRAQATVAKESRVKTSLEKMVEDLEWKLAESGAELERLRDAMEGGRKETAGGSEGGGAGGAANALRDALDVDHEGAADDGAPAKSAEAPSEEGDPVADEDDLMRIKGVGAVLAKKLRAAGVTSFRQIADWTDEDLEEISRKLRLRNRAERGDWRGQARRLCERK